MAQLKDLIVNGTSRLIGNAFVNILQLTTLHAPTTAGGSTYGAGTNGQLLKTNGSSIYWDNNTLSHKLKIGTYTYDGSSDVTIPVYDGSIS